MQVHYRSIRHSVGRMSGRVWAPSVLLGSLVLAAATPPAHALLITPTFDSTITGASNAADIENAINTAIGTMDGLYSNSITVAVDFKLGPGSFLGRTDTTPFDETYSAYTNALKADFAANPSNTILGAAIANLSKGNNANGGLDMAITQAQTRMLGLGSASGFDATVTLSTTLPLDYIRPIPPYNGSNLGYDAIGVIEHELDEVLGGGGLGSTLNAVASSCRTNPSGFLCDKYGSLDLYRYSAPNKPSFTTSGLTGSYFSVDGGSTNIVSFNQSSAADFGDWGPNTGCGVPGFLGGPDALIQDAMTCPNQQREDYTTASPEFTMLESIGWDPVPEPGTIAMLGASLLGLAAMRRRR
jgi:hypothetical protein